MNSSFPIIPNSLKITAAFHNMVPGTGPCKQRHISFRRKNDGSTPMGTENVQPLSVTGSTISSAQRKASLYRLAIEIIKVFALW